MKYCMYCGQQIEDEALYCPFCGKKLPNLTSHSSIEEPEQNVYKEQGKPYIYYYVVLILCLIASLAFVFYKSSNNKVDNLQKPECPQKDSLQMVLQTTHVIEDSTQAANDIIRQTPDMKFLNVFGHVKRVKDGSDYYVYSFDSKGNITSAIYAGSNCRIKRNSNGQIIALDYTIDTGGEIEGDIREFSYNADGYIIKEEYEYGSIKYSYNGGGNPIKAMVNAEISGTTKYSYTKFDSHGNWTRRKEVTVSEEYEEGAYSGSTTRHIEYYE